MGSTKSRDYNAYNPQLVNELLTVMKTPDSTIVEEGVESINNRG